MIIRVIPDLVSFVDDAANKPGVTFGVHAHQEKRRFQVCCFENVQNLWCPSGVGTVVKGDCDLMLAAGTLMIKRREFCERHVFRYEVTISVHSKLAQSIGALLVNGYNFPIANISDCVSRFYQFERL